MSTVTNQKQLNDKLIHRYFNPSKVTVYKVICITGNPPIKNTSGIIYA